MPPNENILSVREADKIDFENIIDYFLNADKDFLLTMGVDASKLPQREEWLEFLFYEHRQPIQSKKFFYVIWLLNGVAAGHSNINKIIFSEEAYMHLHIWNTDKRQKGTGVKFIEMTLCYYFQKFELQNLYCEPYALNIAQTKR